MFEGVQVIFLILRWIAGAISAVGLGMAAVTLVRSGAYPPPPAGLAMWWFFLACSGVGLWMTATIGEMLGYCADRLFRLVAIAERQGGADH